MQNPFDPAYLTSAAAGFGPLAWIFFLVQIAALLWGLYAAFVRSDNTPYRKTVFKNFGLALAGLASLGIILGSLRLAGVAPFTQRFWLYIPFVLEVLLGAYALYYARAVYPKKLALTRTRRGKTTSRQAAPRATAASRSEPASSGGNGAASDDEPEVAGSGSRRSSARHRRKRKTRS